MPRSEYYRKMRELALLKRSEHGIETASLNLTAVRKIYKKEGIRIDSWDIKGRKIKAAYFCDDTDSSVLVNRNLPATPRLFALVHELKHHYIDQDIIRGGELRCGDYNANELIEKGAEVFAAEFIYPEAEMLQLARQLGIQPATCTPDRIVELKRACPVDISYQSLVKRLEWCGFIAPGSCAKIQFQKLEEQIHGLPIYKQAWFKAHRARKKQQTR